MEAPGRPAGRLERPGEGMPPRMREKGGSIMSDRQIQTDREWLIFIEKDIDTLDQQIHHATWTITQSQSALERLSAARDSLLAQAQEILDRLDGKSSA